MPKPPHVNLIKQVKVNGKWRAVKGLCDRKGRVRPDRVRVNGQDEAHPEGSYFIEWWDQGERRREAAGANAKDAADKARVREAELTAARFGVVCVASHRLRGDSSSRPSICSGRSSRGLGV